MRCPICGKDYPKGFRAVHAHMMKDHLAEYRKNGCSLKNYGIDINAPENKHVPKKTVSAGPEPKPQPKMKTQNNPEPPDDFRPLNRSDPGEKEAYDEGNRYYSGGNAYTADECRAKGWI